MSKRKTEDEYVEVRTKRVQGGDASMPLGPTNGPAPGFSDTDPVAPAESDLSLPESTKDFLSKQYDFTANVQDRVEYDFIKDDGYKRTYVNDNANKQQFTISWNHGTFSIKECSKMHFKVVTPANPNLANKVGLKRVGKELGLIHSVTTYIGTNNLKVGGGAMEPRQWVESLIDSVITGKFFQTEDTYNHEWVMNELIRFGILTKDRKLMCDPNPVNMSVETSQRYVPGEDMVVDWYMDPENLVHFDANGQAEFDVYCPLIFLSGIFRNNLPDNIPLKMTIDLSVDVKEVIIPWSAAMNSYETIKACKLFGKVPTFDYSKTETEMAKDMFDFLERNNLVKIDLAGTSDNQLAALNAEVQKAIEANPDPDLLKYFTHYVVPQPSDLQTDASDPFNEYWNPADVKLSFILAECWLEFKQLTFDKDIKQKREEMKLRNLTLIQINDCRYQTVTVPDNVNAFNINTIQFPERPTAITFGISKNTDEITGFFSDQYRNCTDNTEPEAAKTEYALAGTYDGNVKKFPQVNGIVGVMRHEFDLSMITGFQLYWECLTNNSWVVDEMENPKWSDWLNSITFAKALHLNRANASGASAIEKFYARLTQLKHSIYSDFSIHYNPGLRGKRANWLGTVTGATPNLTYTTGVINSILPVNPITHNAKFAKTISRKPKETSSYYHQVELKWKGCFMSGKSENSIWNTVKMTEQFIASVGFPGGRLIFNPNPRGGFNPVNTTDPSMYCNIEMRINLHSQARSHLGFGRRLATPFSKNVLPGTDISKKQYLYPAAVDGHVKELIVTGGADAAIQGAVTDASIRKITEINADTLSKILVPSNKTNVQFNADSNLPLGLGEFGFVTREITGQYSSLQITFGYSQEIYIVVEGSNQATYSNPQTMGI